MIEETSRLLLDKLEVSEVISRYCHAIDTRDWGLLTSCFTEDCEADFRSFGSREVVRGRDSWVAAIKDTIGGLDVTHHATSNHMSEIDDDAAKLTAYIEALHWLQNDLGDPEYTVGGYYNCHMNRQPDGWRIARYSLTVTWQRGNRHILRLGRRWASVGGE
jgi:hypothetical protein